MKGEIMILYFAEKIVWLFIFWCAIKKITDFLSDILNELKRLNNIIENEKK